MPELVLDVRTVRKPDKHPQIFEQFDALAVGESFVLINNHDPKHLREEFATDHPGEFSWQYLQRGPERWEIRITRLASTPLPRILCDTHETAIGQLNPDASGAIWKLQMRQRPGRQHHPPAARVPDRSACWCRPRRPSAHPSRRRPTADRGQHAGAAARRAAVAALPVPARNPGRRAGSDLPHRPLTTVRIDHPAGAADIAASCSGWRETPGRWNSGHERGSADTPGVRRARRQ